MDNAGRLISLAMFYDQEAKRCAEARAYFAACALEAAALEALFLAMCNTFREEVMKTKVYQKAKSKFKTDNFFDFKLEQFIRAAREAAWLPFEEGQVGRHQWRFSAVRRSSSRYSQSFTPRKMGARP